MTALTKDVAIDLREGSFVNRPVLASTKIYEGAMVGLSAGYGRGLVAGDLFQGHADEQADNSAVATNGAIDVRCRDGEYDLEVTLSGVAVTDVGRPVYASDDATLSLNAPGYSFVGIVKRYVTTNTAVVTFKPRSVDEFGTNAWRELKTDDYTVDALDSGKIIYLGTDAKTITLPATDAGLTITIVNSAADGTAQIAISPNASDKIMGRDLTAADNLDLINTKATAKRGDFVTLVADGADGWFVVAQRGTWAQEVAATTTAGG
jgi:hypothetical protein